MNNPNVLESIVGIARHAGEAIMEVYESDDFNVELKGDDSPLTRADKEANDIIVAKLEEMSELPIVSEENTVRTVEGPFWLVDPLDGTKEFIKRNGQFTVNIALIEDAKPVLGVVYAPAIDTLYAGDVKDGVAFREDESGRREIAAKGSSEAPVIVTSKSHKDERTEALLKAIGPHEEKSMGSSLKLCLVADGSATLYPRLAPTYLWDTAAADAVVTAAGGAVKDLDGERLSYDPMREMKNPYFVVEGMNNTIDWKHYLT